MITVRKKIDLIVDCFFSSTLIQNFISTCTFGSCVAKNSMHNCNKKWTTAICALVQLLLVCDSCCKLYPNSYNYSLFIHIPHFTERCNIALLACVSSSNYNFVMLALDFNIQLVISLDFSKLPIRWKTFFYTIEMKIRHFQTLRRSSVLSIWIEKKEIRVTDTSCLRLPTVQTW